MEHLRLDPLQQHLLRDFCQYLIEYLQADREGLLIQAELYAILYAEQPLAQYRHDVLMALTKQLTSNQ